MIKTRITTAIREIIEDDCGFDAFVMMKDDRNPLKKLNLYEGKPENEENNFKAKIGASIKNTIKSKFLAEESEYCRAESIEDNQNKFYVIQQDADYEPFQVINLAGEEVPSFYMSERDAAQGFLFRFAVDDIRVLWAYQHIWSTTIPQKKKGNTLMKVFASECGDTFVEMTDVLFPITPKVDILIVVSRPDADVVAGQPEASKETVTEIVTSDISLMERTFGLETFIRSSAHRVIDAISTVGLIAGTDKLTEYLSRNGGNKKYARKMMRIKDSKVFGLSADQLRNKLTTVPRWRGKFELDNMGMILLKTFKNVEDLIDLFDERYTRSDITGQEYDTSVKSIATDIETNP